MEENLKIIIELEPEEYSLLKLAEELSELSELVIKRVTKPNGKDSAERLNHLVEEFGDVMLRSSVVIYKLNLSSNVAKRYNKKLKDIAEACKQRYVKGEILV